MLSIHLIKEQILTKRETETLKLVADGLSSKKIAERIFITPDGVEAQRKSMIRKTGAGNITQVVAMAIRKQWIP